MSKSKKFFAVLAITALASFGVVGPSSAANGNAPVKGDRGGIVMYKIGDTWCC